MNVTSAQVAYIDNHRSDKVVRRYSAYVITPLWLSCGDKAERGSAMLAKSFLEEVEADMHKGEPVWRETGDGHGRVYSLRT